MRQVVARQLNRVVARQRLDSRFRENDRSRNNRDRRLCQDVFVVGAEFFSFAWGAVGASPDVVELLHDFGDDVLVIGDNAGLEVSLVLALGAHAGAGEIGAAGIGEIAVHDHGLEMHPRAQDSLHALYQVRVFVEIVSKGWARLLGVQQPYLHAPAHQIGKDLKKRHPPAALVHVKVFQIRGCYPDELAGLWNPPANHLLVYVSIRDVLDHPNRIQNSAVRSQTF